MQKVNNRVLVSVSGKYKSVLKILEDKDIDNKSEYICQAILEKYNRDKDEKIEDLLLEKKIRKLILEIINENPNISFNNELRPSKISSDEKIETTKELDEALSQKLSNIMDEW